MPSLPKFGPRVTFTGFYQEFSKVIDFVMVSAASLRKIKVVQTGVIVENDSCNVGSTMGRQVSINVCLLSLFTWNCVVYASCPPSELSGWITRKTRFQIHCLTQRASDAFAIDFAFAFAEKSLFDIPSSDHIPMTHR